MKNFYQITIITSVLLLAACSSVADTSPDPASVQKAPAAQVTSSDNNMMDDHHEGEENVEAHGHTDAEVKLPPSRSKIEGTVTDDHHEGEENIEAHDH